MNDMIFFGVSTALVTPFCDGSVDYAAFGKMIDAQINAGITALTVAGTTGESPTLSHSEKYAMFGYAAERADGKCKIIAGTGSNDTAAAVKLSRNAATAGCDAVLVVTPYYNKATEEGLYSHYSRIAEAAKIPVIAYNVPSRTGFNMPIGVLKRLYEAGVVKAIKEASGDLGYDARIAAECPGIAIYSGNDDRTAAVMGSGGKGVISVVSNAYPEKVKKICEAMKNGDVNGAARAQAEIMTLCEILFEEVNPVPIKYMMARLGYCKEEYRLPLTAPKESTKRKIDEYVKNNT